MRNFVPRLPSSGESVGRLDKPFSAVYADALVDESNIRAYGAKGDGATDDTGALLAAIAYFDGADATILFPKGEYIIADDVTVPENICLKFEKGGKVVVSDTFTLTINGPIEAGLWYIFDGDGTVTGSTKIEAVYPEWFGAVGDGTTDDTVPMQKTLDSFVGSEIIFNQSYSTSLGVVAPIGSKLSGNGHFYLTDISKDCVKHLGNGYIKGLSFHGDGTYDTSFKETGYPQALIAIEGDSVQIEKCTLKNPPAAGVTLRDCSFTLLVGNTITCNYVDTGDYGHLFMLHLNTAKNTVIKGNFITGGIQGIVGGGKDGSNTVDNTLVEGNTIIECINNSMYFSNYSSNTKVISNFFQSGINALTFEGGPNLVQGNTFFGVGGIKGRNVFNTQIVDNAVFTANSTVNDSGINISGDTFKRPCNDVIISNNILTHTDSSSTRTGIFVTGSVWDGYQATISNIIISKNILKGYGTNTVGSPHEGSSIQVRQTLFGEGSEVSGETGKNIVIDGNVMSSSGEESTYPAYGIWLLNGLDRCSVSNNIISGCSAQFIHLRGVTNSVFSGNSFYKPSAASRHSIYEREDTISLHFNSRNNTYYGNNVASDIVKFSPSHESAINRDVFCTIVESATPTTIFRQDWPSVIVYKNVTSGNAISIQTDRNWPIGYSFVVVNANATNTFSVYSVNIAPNTSKRFTHLGSDVWVASN